MTYLEGLEASFLANSVELLKNGILDLGRSTETLEVFVVTGSKVLLDSERLEVVFVREDNLYRIQSARILLMY